MSPPRVLFLAHRIPYPPDKGDKIRTWRIVEHLARRSRVALAAFVDDPADFAGRKFLEDVCESVALVPMNKKIATLRSAAGFLTGEALTLPYYRDARMAKAVREARATGVAAEIAFSSSMAPYLLKPRGGAPTIIDICDADSAKWAEYAKRKNWPMSAVYAREAKRLARAETEIINGADVAFAITEEEADLLGSRDGVEKEVRWFANGVAADYFAPGLVKPHERRIDAVFVGAMDYWANVDAVVWFVKEIWPQVRAHDAEASFAIVGAKPAKEILALDGRDGVFVTGRVEDVRPYVEAARLVVAPLRIARGIQNKVLEAMAMGKAVVTTPAGLEGIDAQMGLEAVAAASPDAFAREMIRLLEDPARAGTIGRAARARILADYQWSSRLAPLDRALDEALAQKR